jgi:hypothetical protein
MIGHQIFRSGASDMRTAVQAISTPAADHVAAPAQAHPLRVTVSGGGPVGLSFALLLEYLMGTETMIKVHDSRWRRDGDRIVWKGPDQGNIRRQQVVTIQSRQYLKLPPEVQERLLTPGSYSEMWPKGPDSIQDLGPRNVRIAHVEDQLLAIANDTPDHIQLIPEHFDPATAQGDIAGQHVLAVCEGSRSRSLEHYADKFGQATHPCTRWMASRCKTWYLACG